MPYSINQNIDKYALCLALTNFGFRLIMMIVHLFSIDLPPALTRSVYAFVDFTYLVLLCYLTYILKSAQNKKSVIFAFIFYISISLINILHNTFTKRVAFTNGTIVLGSIAFISTIFLFTQVFRIKKSSIKLLCILMVSVIFFMLIVNIIRPIVLASMEISVSENIYYYLNISNNILYLFISAFFVAILSTLHRTLFKQNEIL